MKKGILTDHTLIIHELESRIKLYNLDLVLPFLPKGSFLVGGFIRDTILGKMKTKVDVDIVVPNNAINIGKRISDDLEGKFIILDKDRDLVRIILNHISIDIANQTFPTIIKDLQSRDFSINSVAFLFDKKCLIDPLNGLKDIQLSLIRTFSKDNLIDDPLRILRCFRFVSEFNFDIDKELTTFIETCKDKLRLVSNERINYELKRIVRGTNAIKSIQLLKGFDLFGIKKKYNDQYLLNLNEINFNELSESEREKFMPLFFIVQILDEATFRKLQFSKAEISNTNLLRKWYLIIRERNIYELNELERFNLHQELEDILPSFIFYLPENFHLDWLNRWRDKNDKLFHPSNLINGEVLKKHLNIKEGPLLGELLNYLSKELAYNRLNNFDEAIYKAKQWIEQNAPKCD